MGGDRMYNILGIQTEYSLLNSLIRIKDIIAFCKEHDITTVGLLDDNLNGAMDFYDNCTINNIQPIIGLSLSFNDTTIYLYAKNYLGYQSLLQISIQDDLATLTPNESLYNDIFCNDNLYLVIPYKYIENYKNLLYMKNTYIAYQNTIEKKASLLYTNNILFINRVKTLKKEDLKYLKYLYKIGNSTYEEDSYNTIIEEISLDDRNRLDTFCRTIDIKIPKNNRYIPKFKKDIDSRAYLSSLSFLGLKKRLNDTVSKNYIDRLSYELGVIDKMGFNDYFLIVYDYVKYAKTHNILVGPGRGSAAGSLVSYCLGITEIDPLKYNLLFERFLNKDRVTMPDIDIDFEDTKREEMISYVRNKYGINYVAPILTYGTLQAKQVIRDIARVIAVAPAEIDKLSKLINPNLNLKDNLANSSIKNILSSSSSLKKVYEISLKLEGLKRHTSTHAAGVVISSVPLITSMPLVKVENGYNTGLVTDYLEELGFLKMDFLALSNLNFIHNILNTIEPINLNKIPLDDPLVYQLFSTGDTAGIFQFESSGMTNFLRKLKPTCFEDLYAAVALFRPGPMDNIDLFIKRKNKLAKVEYLHPDLEPILKETYGIIVYQEQIMQILVKMGGYSFAEADNIRRAMSKKEKEIIDKEKDTFINKGLTKGYKKDTLVSVYNLILKFANYGFNKAHSVSYAYLGYQMAYLKVHYKEAFLTNLLNLAISSPLKTKEYLNTVKSYNIKLIHPDIRISMVKYTIKNNIIIMPLTIIKGLSSNAATMIVLERKKLPFQDYFDIVDRLINLGIKRNILENLIYGKALSYLNINIHTMISNLDGAINYSEVLKDFDSSLIDKPLLKEEEEYSNMELMNKEYEIYGFYVSNHPASRFNVLKTNMIPKYLGKYINTVLLIEDIHKIKTKKNEDMAFLKGSDEVGTIELVMFPKYINLISNTKIGDLVKITGEVAKRLDKYQINIIKIESV